MGSADIGGSVVGSHSSKIPYRDGYCSWNTFIVLISTTENLNLKHATCFDLDVTAMVMVVVVVVVMVIVIVAVMVVIVIVVPTV